MRKNLKDALRGGNVVEYKSRYGGSKPDFGIVVGVFADSVRVYSVESRGYMKPVIHGADQVKLDDILVVHQADDVDGVMLQDCLYWLIERDIERPIWKKEGNTREMTVDEISERLGYRVRVVGNRR